MTQKIEVPAVAYLTNASKDYYDRKEGVEAIGFTLRLAWDESRLTFPDAAGDTVVYERIPESETDPRFLNGRVLFYKIDDPTLQPPVRRVAALGLQGRGEFGFFKTVDYLGYSGEKSSARSSGIDFQIFASNGGNYRHETVIEAGSLTNLA